MQKEVVLLHGWGMNKQVWQVFASQLQDGYAGNVKCLDLPGFGDAPLPTEAYSLSSAAAVLAEQINDDSIIVGWSLGGLFALHLAKHFPEKVNKVIMLASSPFFSEAEEWAGIKPEVLENFKAQLAQDSNKTIERFLAIQAMGSEHAKADIKQLKTLLAQSPNAQDVALNAGLDILQQVDYRGLFVSLQQPIHGLFGRLDSLVPKRAVKAMMQLNPQFDAHILPKASHAPFISHREESLSYLKSVL